MPAPAQSSLLRPAGSVNTSKLQGVLARIPGSYSLLVEDHLTMQVLNESGGYVGRIHLESCELEWVTKLG